jgi:hypothetical protein
MRKHQVLQLQAAVRSLCCDGKCANLWHVAILPPLLICRSKPILALRRIRSQQAADQQQQTTVSAVTYTGLFAGGAEGIVRQANGLRAFLATFLYCGQRLETASTAAVAASGKPPRHGPSPTGG